MSAVHLNIALSPSQQHRQWLWLIQVLIFLLILILPLSLFARALLLMSLLLNAVWILKNLRRVNEITRLLFEYNQVAVVILGQQNPVQQLIPIFVSNWLMILKLDLGDQTYWLPLWSDSADREQLRQLRVWLLCGKWRRENQRS